MKTFIRGWEYEPPALKHVMGLMLTLVFIGAIVFKGPVADVLLGGVLLLCFIVMVATNRTGWKHMTPFWWVLFIALLVTTLVDYVVATPVTHAVQRTVYWVSIVRLIAKRFDVRSYWREVTTPGNDHSF